MPEAEVGEEAQGRLVPFLGGEAHDAGALPRRPGGQLLQKGGPDAVAAVVGVHSQALRPGFGGGQQRPARHGDGLPGDFGHEEQGVGGGQPPVEGARAM